MHPHRTGYTEIPFFFSNGSCRLFGCLHEPAPSTKRRSGIVLCAPFAEEKLIAHRVLVNMARTLAGKGHAVLRFDFMGEGDSDGNFEDTSIATRLADIAMARTVLVERTGVNRTALIGVRFGATLAALAACQTPVDSLALIAPIISGKQYMEHCLRSNLTTQLSAFGKITKDRLQLISDLMDGQTVNIDGYLVSKALYQEMIGIDLLQDPVPAASRVMILNVSRDEMKRPDPGLDKLYTMLKETYPDTAIAHVREDPFWKDGKIYTSVTPELNRALVTWFSQGADS